MLIQKKVMSSSFGPGRLGNHIIRNLALSICAEKFDLTATYASVELIEKLGIILYNGSQKYQQTIQVNNNTFWNIYPKETVHVNLDFGSDYFQTKEICNLIYQYLQSDSIKQKIIEQNPFKDRYHNNDDVFIHIRLDDATRFNPGLQYYIDVINTIIDSTQVINRIYISTDQKDHEFIKSLLNLYSNTELIEYDEITTFQFASTCKKIILSHGSFSAVIGYLSFYSTIYYPDYSLTSYIWFGDMFSIPGWIRYNTK